LAGAGVRKVFLDQFQLPLAVYDDAPVLHVREARFNVPRSRIPAGGGGGATGPARPPAAGAAPRTRYANPPGGPHSRNDVTAVRRGDPAAHLGNRPRIFCISAAS